MLGRTVMEHTGTRAKCIPAFETMLLPSQVWLSM
jgi:hypothetical protein